MIRIAKTLASVFAITAIIAANSPVRMLANEAAQLIVTSDEVLTSEFSAVRHCAGPHCNTTAPRHVAAARRRSAASGAHRPTRVGTGHKPANAGTGPSKMGSGPGKMRTGSGNMSNGPEKLGSGPSKIGTGPGKLDKGPGAAKATKYFYEGQTPNNAGQPSTPSTVPTTPTTVTIEVNTEVLTREFPKWRKGDPLPPGWTNYPGYDPDGRPTIYIDPPHGYRTKKDGALIPNRTDFDRLHAAVAECEKPYLKDADDYFKTLQEIRAKKLEMIKSREDTSEIDQQIRDTDSMRQMKLDQAHGCYDRINKIFEASGYNSTE
jgi:hypothetical protein